jgi:hypothetical protein
MSAANMIAVRLPKNVPGIVNALHWAMQFAAWAASLHAPPTAQQISEHFGVSRATGYRYRSAWEAAVFQNIIPPPTEGFNACSVTTLATVPSPVAAR